MKKMLKRNSGFTLIELIVVIAILAILAGVGTVAYSGYINKAHKANDIQLAGDVRYALELAAVTPETELENGAVVLANDGIHYVDNNGNVLSDSKLEAAVKKAFGDTSNLKLQYANWRDEASGAVDVSFAIRGSNYKNTESLIGSVQNLTDNLKTYSQTNDEITKGAFGTYLGETGVDTDDDQAIANAATLFVANRVQNTKTEKINEVWEKSNTTLTVRNNQASGGITFVADGQGTGTDSTLANLAISYASAQAAIEYIKSSSGVTDKQKTDLDNYMKDMFSGDSASQITSNLSSKQTILNNYIASDNTLRNAYNRYVNDPNEEYDSENNQTAFIKSMNAVNELDKNGDISNNLSKGNLYNDIVSPMVTSYMNAGTILNGYKSAIAIMCADNGSGYTITSYPYFD